MTIKQFIFVIIIFALTHFDTFAQYPTEARQLSLYYGQTYRINDKFYHSFDISYEQYNHTCLTAKFKGAGVRLDYFDNDNFSVGLRYFRSLFRRAPDVMFNPYYCFSPVVFRFDNDFGLNIKPEIGIRLNTGEFTTFGLSFNISYGYDIPIISENKFTAGRHDLSAKIALTINLDTFGSLFKKKTTETDDNKDIENKE